MIIEQIILVIYDGSCGICNKTIQFILDNKPKPIIRFVSFQSKKAQPYIKKYNIKNMDSVVIIERGKSYTKSTAMLRLVKNLKTNWRYVYYLIVIPRPIRDLVYSIISKNRYRFTKKEFSCRLLSNKEKAFFISDY